MNHHLIPETIRQELVVPNALNPQSLASGGLSGASIWMCQSSYGPFALRCWPAEHPTPQRLSDIHAAMYSARSQGVEYVPSLLNNRHGKSFTSDGLRLWEVTQWMPGAADYLHAPSTPRLQAALEALATLHRVWQMLPATPEHVAVGPSPAMLERYRRLEVSLRQLRDWTRLPLGDSPHRSLATQTLQHLAVRGPQLLELLRPLCATPVPLHFVLRDVWSDHLLFVDERVTGIIDYGAARLDEPATDVARLLGSLEPFDERKWLVGWEAYQTLNPQVDLERVRMLDRVGTLLSALQWLQWLVLEPRAFDASAKQLVERWQRLITRLELAC